MDAVNTEAHHETNTIGQPFTFSKETTQRLDKLRSERGSDKDGLRVTKFGLEFNSKDERDNASQMWRTSQEVLMAKAIKSGQEGAVDELLTPSIGLLSLDSDDETGKPHHSLILAAKPGPTDQAKLDYANSQIDLVNELSKYFSGHRLSKLREK